MPSYLVEITACGVSRLNAKRHQGHAGRRPTNGCSSLIFMHSNSDAGARSKRCRASSSGRMRRSPFLRPGWNRMLTSTGVNCFPGSSGSRRSIRHDVATGTGSAAIKVASLRWSRRASCMRFLKVLTSGVGPWPSCPPVLLRSEPAPVRFKAAFRAAGRPVMPLSTKQPYGLRRSGRPACPHGCFARSGPPGP